MVARFVRSYLSPEAARKHAAGAVGELSPFEDFNFSKASGYGSQELHNLNGNMLNPHMQH